MSYENRQRTLYKIWPKIVFDIQKKGFDIFLDLKFHDIPTTVYKACLSALSLDIWMLNIHLSGGLNMALQASKAKQDSQSSCILLGVTALTSLSDDDCFSVYGCNRDDQLKRLKSDRFRIRTRRFCMFTI